MNSRLVYWRKMREQLCNVLADKVNKEDLSTKIDQSVVMSFDMSTGELKTGMSHEDTWGDDAKECGPKWQVRRRLGGQTREEDLIREVSSGEQDKRREARSREGENC